MTQALALSLIVAGLAVGAFVLWTLITWAVADPTEPWFGPASKNRVTYKQVVINAFADAHDVARSVWRALGLPSIIAWTLHLARDGWHNRTWLAVLALDAYAGLAPQLREILANDWRTWVVLAALNLVVQVSARPRPQAAPQPAAA